jgi:hypothetical protein
MLSTPTFTSPSRNNFANSAPTCSRSPIPIESDYGSSIQQHLTYLLEDEAAYLKTLKAIDSVIPTPFSFFPPSFFTSGAYLYTIILMICCFFIYVMVATCASLDEANHSNCPWFHGIAETCKWHLYCAQAVWTGKEIMSMGGSYSCVF